ncbi:hypothetical protein F383_27146 [Gossypium arboreum]|uniref:Uncharacterized protein n=1 Tax=Gossypium arboreum TaxID=29729 RepID=A0A0B0PG35_GOSAR|nr:hypothetical protein F383_27146 [Gossypium arboreum]
MPKLSVRDQRRSWRRERMWASNERAGGCAWCANVCGGEALMVVGGERGDMVAEGRQFLSLLKKFCGLGVF